MSKDLPVPKNDNLSSLSKGVCPDCDCGYMMRGPSVIIAQRLKCSHCQARFVYAPISEAVPDGFSARLDQFDTETKGRYFFNVVGEAIMNPAYEGYAGGRIEVFDAEDPQGYAVYEGRWLVPVELEDEFRDTFDFRKVDLLPRFHFDIEGDKKSYKERIEEAVGERERFQKMLEEAKKKKSKEINYDGKDDGRDRSTDEGG